MYLSTKLRGVCIVSYALIISTTVGQPLDHITLTPEIHVSDGLDAKFDVWPASGLSSLNNSLTEHVEESAFVNWDKVVEFSAKKGSAKVEYQFEFPISATLRKAIAIHGLESTSLELTARYQGPAANYQLWSFSLLNFRTNTYDALADTQSVNSWKWKTIRGSKADNIDGKYIDLRESDKISVKFSSVGPTTSKNYNCILELLTLKIEFSPKTVITTTLSIATSAATTQSTAIIATTTVTTTSTTEETTAEPADTSSPVNSGINMDGIIFQRPAQPDLVKPSIEIFDALWSWEVWKQNRNDGICSYGEWFRNSPSDCPILSPSVCNNGVCEADENYQSCPLDCFTKKYQCGDGICGLPFPVQDVDNAMFVDAYENSYTCPLDCPHNHQRDNGVCEPTESCFTSPG
eukprot:Awhi_evm3s10335